MKHVRKIMLALCGMAMLAGAASCKKEKAENGNDGDELRITASLERAAGNEKTHLEDNSVAWDGYDEFLLYPIDGTEGELFRYKAAAGGGDKTKAVFTGKRPGDAPYYACYYNPNPPADPKVRRNEEGEFVFDIPARQPGNPDVQSATSYTGPMIGYMKDENSDMNFKNLMSWLKVGLKGNATIKRVVLTDNENNLLNGTLTVSGITAGVDGTITGFITTMTGGTSTLEIVSEEGVELQEAPTYFWFLVPEGTLKSLTLNAYTTLEGDDAVLTLTDKTVGASGMPGNTIVSAVVNESIIITPPTPPVITPLGAISGLFSVADGKQVYFSQGNLQYIGSASPAYWKFADNQYTYIGKNGQHSTSSAAVDRDLFGWGCTGNLPPTSDNGYQNYQPWATSKTALDPTNVYNNYGYGPSLDRTNPNDQGEDERDLLVSNGSDWGANSIKVGDVETNGWRTLSSDEWMYIINNRENHENLYGLGTVNGVHGIIILPDNWTLPSDLDDFVPYSNPHVGYGTDNVYSGDAWGQMHTAGAVFLPAAGRRSGTNVNDQEKLCGYMISTHNDSANGGNMSVFYYNSEALAPNAKDKLCVGSLIRCMGVSVRLVKDVPAN